MEQYMKHLITWEWDDVSLLPEAVQEVLPTIYVPRQGRPFLEAFNTYIDNYIWSWKDVFALEFIHADAIKKKNLLTYQSINI